MTIVELLLYLVLGMVIWAVLYGAFFGTLDHLVRRGVADRKVPRYVGSSQQPAGARPQPRAVSSAGAHRAAMRAYRR